MDFLGPVRRFDTYQQRTKGLAVGIAVWKKFSNDQGGNLAALVAYYAFFSIFPLLLAMTTILGFVLHGDPSFQQSVESSVLKELPIVGKQIQSHALKGSVVALVLGVLASLWGGMGVTTAAQNALDKVWAVPYKDRPNFLISRGRGLSMLVLLGLLFLVSTAASGLVAGGFGGTLSKLAGYLVSLAVNVVLFLLAFRFLTAKSVTTQDLRIGAIVAAVLWTILQSIGGAYVDHVVKSDSNTYGTFAFVIALLVWLHLGAQMTLYAAELNVVLKRRLWPRSLFGPPEAQADQRTLTAIAKVEERSQEQHVDVAFDPAVRTADRETPAGSAPPAMSTAHPPPDSPRTTGDEDPERR